MKKLILIVIFSITISTYLNSQNSFPTSNAMWNEYIKINYVNYERPLGLLGDTIINDTLYNKLYEFTDTVLSVENIYCPIGLLRTEGEKVWFKPKFWTNPDILLYDFGAEVGDTVKHNANIEDHLNGGHYLGIWPQQGVYSVILSITIENNRKIYNTTSGIWHEGMGCRDGLLRSMTTSVPLSNSYAFSLLCFKHNDTVKYLLNNICNKCFCPVINVEENFCSDLINIYPNPTTDILNIETPESIKLKSIAIYGIDGKLIEKNRYSYNTGKLNISNLKKGSYILKLEADNIIYKKLIIKD